MIRGVFLLFAAGLAGAQTAQVAGNVTDPAGAAVPGARVLLLTADQTIAASVLTNREGRYQIGPVRPGPYVLTVSKTEFAPQRLAVRLESGQPLERPVRLVVSAVKSEVTVTAETSMVESTDQIAQRVNVISGEMIEERVATTAAEAIREEVGVDLQRTSGAMGGIAVRGLLGRNVNVYRDGVRFTTSAQRGGVSTFLNLTEATGLESVEVLRGPSSAQYGSDSLGGTIHFQSRVAPLGGTPPWRAEASAMYTSATHGFGPALGASYSGNRLGVLLNLAARRINTLRPGQGIDSHAAVTRFLGLPSTVLGRRVADSAFTQYGGALHVLYALTPRSQLSGHYERNHQDGSKRPDQLAAGDGNLLADVRNLMLDFAYLRYARFETGPFDQVQFTGSYNTQREERVNQGGNGNPRADITSQYERMKVWGANFFASRRIRRNDFLAGGDLYRETPVAPAYTFHFATGVATPSRPRIPDGARYLLYGLFIQDVWEPLASGRLRLSGAVRFGGASYRSRAANSPLVNGRPLWPDDSAAANAVTGRLGAVYEVAQPLRIFAQYSRGFRAPSVTDLGTIGLQGNGAFETSASELAGRGATIGDRADTLAAATGRAVVPVRPETSDSFDLGFLVRGTRVRFEASAFHIRLNDTIASQTLLLPPGAVGQALGDQQISRQLATGAVFVPLSNAPVQVRGNLKGARTYGVEQQLEWQISRSFSFAENLTWIYAEDRVTGLAPDIEGGTPPVTANLRWRYAPGGQRFWTEVYGVLAGRQDRLSSLALADRRTGAPRSRAGIASFFANGARVRGLVVNNILASTGETLAQVQERVLGGLDSAPLFSAVPGYGVWGWRGGVRLAEGSDVFIDFSNILDKNFRGISWGVDGPGRGVTIRYRYQF